VSLLMLLDLSAALDTVDHQLLLTVLASRFCVHDVALNWFRSYLSDRHQTFHFSSRASTNYSVDCSVPQGSVLGPIGFISYTEDFVDVINRHDVRSHFYADDMQLYASCHPDNISDVRLQLSVCAADVSKWCASRRLQMNSDKTEIVWFGSRTQWVKLAVHSCSFRIGSETVQPASAVRVFGMLFVSKLTMKSHIARTASACFCHLRRLRQIRRRVGEDVAIRLVLALITSRLGYCNSTLAELPKSTLDPLQQVQNIRLIFQLGQARPCDAESNSVPLAARVRSRVQYKLCLFMHHILSGGALAYLMNSVQATSARTRREGLRSTATTNYLIPRLRSLVSALSHTLVRLPGTHCLLICVNKLSHLLSKSCSKHSLSLHSTSTNSFYDFCNVPMFFFVMRAITNIFIAITIGINLSECILSYNATSSNQLHYSFLNTFNII
jgi:Reverse transcriptase (RNA-dependent DNA polymerase)